jgi:hypothetical protein
MLDRLSVRVNSVQLKFLGADKILSVNMDSVKYSSFLKIELDWKDIFKLNYTKLNCCLTAFSARVSHFTEIKFNLT